MSKSSNPLSEAALYYVRLKTHDGSNLFALSEIERSEIERSETERSEIERSETEHSETLWSKTELSNNQQASSQLTSLAKIAADELLLAAQQRGITLEQWVILPHELHALICLQVRQSDSPQQGLRDRNPGKPRALTDFIAGFKAASAKRINLLRNQPGSLVWQRSYSEQRVETEEMNMRLRHNIRGMNQIIISSH